MALLSTRISPFRSKIKPLGALVVIFLILFVSHFSANANGVNLSCALDQNLCDRCPEYQTLFPLEKFPLSLQPLENQFHPYKTLKK